MKKFLCLLLAAWLLLTLCACGGSGEGEKDKDDAQLQVGFGKFDITPTYSVGLASSGTEKHRRHETVVSNLFATCIAVKYSGETYLMYTIDTISVDEKFGELLRAEIVASIPEIKPENIYLAATHTHSAPATGWSDNEPEGKYRREFILNIPRAAKLALADLAPATMEACKFDLEGMSFVRHYIMNDGTYAGDQFGDPSSGYKAQTYDPNHEMILVNFPREGKDSVMLVNWGAHPANPYDEAIGWLNISADHPGWCRDKLEKLTGAKVAYFNGASGDLDFYCYIPEQNHGLNAKEYGEKLADLAYAHIGELKALEVDAVKTAQQVVECTVAHEDEHLVGQCQVIYNIYSKDNDKATATKMALDLGLSSVHHAGAIVSRSRLGESEPRTLNVFRIGPVSFTTGTYEMASEHAGELKKKSPYEYTFQLCGNSRYIPREEAIDYHSYEGDTRRYVRETGDILVGKYVEMLNSIK